MTAEGPVVLCFGVVDEADIVREFLDYHLDLGVDRFVATDVGSTDGTLDILAEYERKNLLDLVRYDDPAVRAQERDWFTPLVERAREKFRAEWCLFCDVDEFWVFPGALRAYLAAAPGPLVNFPRHNMIPSRRAGDTGPGHFSSFDLVAHRPLRIHYLLDAIDTPEGIETLLNNYPPENLRAIAPKVLARTEAIKSVSPGFHHAIPRDPKMPHRTDTSGFVGHFPVRNETQFVSKAKLVAAFIAANPPRADRAAASHWVRLAALYDRGLVREEFLRQVLTEEKVAERLRQNVIKRDGRIATRLAALREPALHV